MPHSYVSCYMHYVFSTKERIKSINPEVKERLWAYMGGIAKENNMKALIVGGTSNHIHILLEIPSTINIAKAIQLIKGGSSKWVSDTFPTLKNFSWQEGYGAFSISVLGIQDTVSYIQNQEKHHQVKTFEEEYVAFLKKHDIDYDERHVWG
ncbi:MAG: REP-associated tyrosine transposase [Candidatus Poribacteria bacterium]|nr:REP-associated tyrosine transposase [Candidatus Poribacteria bacterium]